MELSYDKVALQEYMDDISNVGEALRRVKDESFTLYTACRQKYTRLYGELEQACRKAYNRVEEAESMQRIADAEHETAIRLLDSAEDDAERQAAQEKLRTAQRLQAEAAEEMLTASEDLSKAQAKLQKLTDIWDQYTPALESAAHRVEDGQSAFITLVNNGNRDLGQYIGIMEKARSALYGGTPGQTSPAGSQQSGTGARGSDSPAVSQNNNPSNVTASRSSGVAVGWCKSNSMSAVQVNSNGDKVVSMTIGGTEQQFPCTKSGMARAYRKALKSGDSDMIARTSAMFEIETLREDLELGAGDEGYPQLGGYHRDVKTQDPHGFESHHIPSRSVQDVNAEWLPAISISEEDHKLTSSYSGKQRRVYEPFIPSSIPSVSYKESITQNLERGSPGYIDSVKSELLDLRLTTGHRYDGGVSAYLDTVIDMLASRGIPEAKRSGGSS